MNPVFQSRLSPDAEPPRESFALTDPLLTALPPLAVTGALHLRGMKRLTSMAAGDWHTLCLRGCPELTSLPPHTRPLQRLELDGCGIERLPADLPFAEDAVLIIQNCHRLVSLPAVVSSGRLHSITIRNCPQLEELPPLSARRAIVLERMPMPEFRTPLTAPAVTIARCPKLKAVRVCLEAEKVSLNGCAALEDFTAPAPGLQSLALTGCRSLQKLPDGLKFTGAPAWLDLDGCARITTLPDDLTATLFNTSTAERRMQHPALVVLVEGCPLRYAPEYRFAWRVQIRGVQMEPQALLHPKGIDPSEVLRNRNAEVRRVLLENLGIENLLARTKHKLIDADTDAGGVRRLFHFCLPLRNPRVREIDAGTGFFSWSNRSAGRLPRGSFIMRLFGGGKRPPPDSASPPPPPDLTPKPARGIEVLRCRHLECRCPSTGRLYLLPVPPSITTCRAAAAWLAGFENPDDYAPVQET